MSQKYNIRKKQFESYKRNHSEDYFRDNEESKVKRDKLYMKKVERQMQKAANITVDATDEKIEEYETMLFLKKRHMGALKRIVSVSRHCPRLMNFNIGGIVVEIRNLDLSYLEDAVNMAQENYEMERKHIYDLPDSDYKIYFKTELEKLFKIGNGKMAFENDIPVGYLVFGDIFNINEFGDKGATSPLFGYGIRSEKRAVTIGKLFQEVAKELCEKYTQSIRVSIYAHDMKVLQTYIMSAFTMDVTGVIRNVTEPFELSENQGYICKELSKEELKYYRSEIMELYRGLINHLRMSPVFYHCRYFLPLQDRFDDFLTDEMRIFAAFDGNKLIGIIDSEPGGDVFITDYKDTVCMGDVFLNPAYRGMGVAAQMLKYANDKLNESGIKTICVTHGTINPTARGFWDKYFENYSYTMTRQIDRNMLGVIQRI